MLRQVDATGRQLWIYLLSAPADRLVSRVVADRELRGCLAELSSLILGAETTVARVVLYRWTDPARASDRDWRTTTWICRPAPGFGTGRSGAGDPPGSHRPLLCRENS